VKREVISLETARAEKGQEIDMIEEADLDLLEETEEMIGIKGAETDLQGEEMTTPDLTLEVEGMGEETTEMMTEVIGGIGEAQRDLETTIEGTILEIETIRKILRQKDLGLTLTKAGTTKEMTDLEIDLRMHLEVHTRGDGKIVGMPEEVDPREEGMRSMRLLIKSQIERVERL
jgi:hypothetical protein